MTDLTALTKPQLKQLRDKLRYDIQQMNLLLDGIQPTRAIELQRVEREIKARERD